ncbi:UNVERIFIED_CONTAM: hypothetical protein Sangu_3232000 [Sesamum angustifolium]|uniref:Reverse transcriptase domain-containing protein n=1 Tax=Sesamum angustifolium TaxID=2727405 RepID=A0AAW2JHN9_9LAMI
MTRSNGISLVPYYIFFGFPDIFIGWIEECVTTPMFSVCINGNPHGFFKGSRGLRQGDPLSPFLFVLIMEVLQLMLQQLIDQNEGFSFHWRSDVASVRIFRHGLDEFAKLSDFMPTHKRVSSFYHGQRSQCGNIYLQLYSFRRVTSPQVSRPASFSLAAIDFGLPTFSLKLIGGLKGGTAFSCPLQGDSN